MKKLILSTLVAVGLIGSAGAQTQLTGSLTNGLVVWYPLHGNANDYSGNGNNLILTTNTMFSLGKLGETNGSLIVDYDSGGLSSRNISISGNSPRTISLWIKCLEAPPKYWGGFLLAWGEVDQKGKIQSVGYTPNDSGGVEFSNDNFYVSSGITANVSYYQWHHLVCSFNGSISECKYFIDGVQYPTVGGIIDTVNTTPGILIFNGAKLNSHNQGIKGYISDFRIYNRALSSDEVANLYYIESLPPNITNGFGYTTNSNSATILSYTGSNNSVTIPSTIGALPVISIGDNAFANQSNITSITIPNSVTNIGSGAFSGCLNLTQVTIPESVVSFGTGIFSGSSNVAIIGSQSLISYLSQNADSLGFSGNALTSIQYGGTASGTYGWIKTWLLSDNTFLSSIASLIQFPSPAAQNLSNSIAALSAQTSPTNPVFVGQIASNPAFISSVASNPAFISALATNPAFLNALASQLLSSSNNLGIAAKLPQTLTLPAIAPITYSSKKVTTIALKATSSANLGNTTYSISNPSVGIINGANLIILGKGTTTITATNSGNGIYQPASAAQTLIVK